MSQVISGLKRDVGTMGAAGVALLLLFLGVLTNRYRFEFLPLRPHTEHFALGIAFLVLAWLFFTKRMRLRLLRFRLSWSDALLAVYLGLALAASALFPANPLDSVQFWARMLTSTAVYFFARWLLDSTSAAVATKFLLKLLLIYGVLEAGLGIAAWFLYPFGINLGVDEYPLGVRGPGGILCNFSLTTYGTLWEPNVFGGVMMLVILVAAALFVSNHFVARRTYLGVAIAIMLVALALNASRGALGALAIGLVLILFLVRGMGFGEKLKWLVAAVVLLVMVTIPTLELSRVLMQLPSAPGLAQRAPCAEWIAKGMPAGTQPGDPAFDPATGPNSGSSTINKILEGQTLASRWVSYQKAWEEFLQRPLFGNGADSFGQTYTTTAHTPGWISNLFLMSLHDTGIIGTLILTAWFGWFAWMVLTALRRGGDSPTRTLTLALGIGLGCLFVTYQVTTMLWFGLIWFWLAVLEAEAQGLRSRQD